MFLYHTRFRLFELATLKAMAIFKYIYDNFLAVFYSWTQITFNALTFRQRTSSDSMIRKRRNFQNSFKQRVVRLN